MNRILICAAIIGALSVPAFAKKAGVNQLSAPVKETSPVEKLKQNRKAFPYETRVDRETIPGKVIHWYSDGHSVTVTPRVVSSVVLTNVVDAAVIKAKKAKNDYKKAKAKDAKNLEKAVSELKKLRNKSSEEVAALYDDAIEIFEGK